MELNGHVFVNYQVNILQSCEQCCSYIWPMEKACLCSSKCELIGPGVALSSSGFFLIVMSLFIYSGIVLWAGIKEIKLSLLVIETLLLNWTRKEGSRLPPSKNGSILIPQVFPSVGPS